MTWAPGDTVVFRQVWQGKPLFAVPCVVVSDEPRLLVTYLPEQAPCGAVPGWPRPDGVHPWAHRSHWEGRGTLMLRRPDDRYSIWAFWEGDAREFACWYVNLEQPYRRSAIGIDTLDHELDLWSEDGRTWHLKDEDGVQECVTHSRFDEHEAERIWADAADFQVECERSGPWWDLAWAEWQPPADLVTPSLPAGWELVPAA
ncbi:MAG TPA: DUF402 domain-containing protein [Gaiellaceae bacterium]|nr:DUF402 domain-containing protein [Gaiellaceae bacterium]